MTKDGLLVINPRDNVGVTLTARGEIPAGHKIALRDIDEGEAVIKYGAVIGRATKPIHAGEWVHTHNLRTHLDEAQTYPYEPKPMEQAPAQHGTFQGFLRPDGRVGIRNEIYIIPTVGCVNGICKRLERVSQKLIRGSLDGIYALTHPWGCSQLGQDAANLRELLCSIARNPNAAFVLFVGLGCENNRLCDIREELFDRDNVACLTCQEVEDELTEGYRTLCDFADRAAEMSRETVGLEQLCIGLKCGGSDGFSGLTANPLVGQMSDRLVACGGRAVLTEVPEMFGAEQRLMNRCRDRETYARYCKLITDFRDYYTAQGFPVYENPSPGNRAGGITTLEEKSLGCIEKAGHTAICDVLPYAGRVKESGVSVLNAPGNDLIAATALAAAGCQLVLFTTGRGTPFSTFVPTLKIATNSALAQKKSGWIDFNAEPMDADALWSLILRTANGDYRAKSEDLREIAFFKTGVTL